PQIDQERHDRPAVAQPELHVVLPETLRHTGPGFGLDLDVDQDVRLAAVGVAVQDWDRCQQIHLPPLSRGPVRELLLVLEVGAVAAELCRHVGGGEAKEVAEDIAEQIFCKLVMARQGSPAEAEGAECAIYPLRRRKTGRGSHTFFRASSACSLRGLHPRLAAGWRIAYPTDR